MYLNIKGQTMIVETRWELDAEKFALTLLGIINKNLYKVMPHSTKDIKKDEGG